MPRKGSLRVARVVAAAVRLLGDERKAKAWLREPNIALGGKTPLELLRTERGSRQIEDVLGRIEFGVFS